MAANSLSTCLANSLVGANTIQPGALRLPGRAISFSMTGSAIARVLPEPVLARPIKSRPAGHRNHLCIRCNGRKYVRCHQLLNDWQGKRQSLARACPGTPYRATTCRSDRTPASVGAIAGGVWMNCGRAIGCSMTGRANAKVLPESVLARPIKSRPADKAMHLTNRVQCHNGQHHS